MAAGDADVGTAGPRYGVRSISAAPRPAAPPVGHWRLRRRGLAGTQRRPAGSSCPTAWDSRLPRALSPPTYPPGSWSWKTLRPVSPWTTSSAATAQRASAGRVRHAGADPGLGLRDRHLPGSLNAADEPLSYRPNARSSSTMR